MLAANRYVLVGAGVAMLVVLVLVKKNGIAGVAAGVGEAVVDAAGGLVSGGAQAIGDVIGVPRTNETECQKAIREGRWWDASFACPAGTFLAESADGIGIEVGNKAGEIVESLKKWWDQ